MSKRARAERLQQAGVVDTHYHVGPELIVRRSALSFEGGDVVASRQSVLIGGELDVAVAGRHQGVEVQTPHLAKLRRFAELCSG